MRMPGPVRRALRVPSALATYAPALLGAAGSPDQRFVILTIGRSGSGLLVDLLRQQSRVTCDSEILSMHVTAPAALVQARAARARFRGAKAYGFKVLAPQLSGPQRLADPKGFVQQLAARGWIVVGLTRQNILRQCVSRARAWEDQVWHQRGAEAGAREGVVVAPENLVMMMVQQEQHDAFILDAVAAAPRGTAFVYEDDLGSTEAQQRTVDRLMSLFGLPSQPVHTDLVPTSPPRLADSIANYDEVADLVSRTRFARFLDP